MSDTAEPVLTIDGLVAGGEARFDRAALARLDPAGQVADVGTLVPGKRGRAVRLAVLAREAGASPTSAHVHLRSSAAGFSVSVPIGEVLESAVLVYELDGRALDASKGGPFRLLACGHPDECVSVKAVERLSFATHPGPDTRPKNDEEHRRLHERARAQHKPS